MSYNYKFVTNTPQPRINAWNFAVNSRCYNPAATGPLYDVNSQFNGTTYTSTSSTVNTDTAMGYPHFHENRMVGRAAYVYAF